VAELSFELIQAATQGDRRAVRALVDLLGPVVQVKVARALLRGCGSEPSRARQEVEDLIQSVFLSLFDDHARALLSWTPEGGMSLSNYIGMLAEREVISILRNRRRNPWTEHPTVDDELDSRSGSGPPHDGPIGSRQVLSMLLERAHEQLNERNLELFHLIVIEERSVEEICTLMSMTPDAVYSARSRLARLARGIAEELTGEASSMGRPA
jgi:RNA polymerase sigma factor (sigma-70 family)